MLEMNTHMKYRLRLTWLFSLVCTGMVASEMTFDTVGPMPTVADTMPAPARYTFRTDVSWAGLPWMVAGIALRHDKENYREIRHKFRYNFHHTADNYSQYVPLILTTGLKAAGIEGRSAWGRYAVSSAASYAVMATLVNAVKYSAKELRPDGSSHNSFPSGHTATAFAAATILHKEYGLTRSPWYSIAGYALATATGCMRVLNNRHWVSDTFAGAGIGILSTELGYAVGDLLFKQKGLVRPDISTGTDLRVHPSFFNVQMGVSVGTQSLDLTEADIELKEYYDDLPIRKLRFSRGTSVGAEGAWFFNPYMGIGGRLRVSSRLVKNWSDFAQSPVSGLTELSPDLAGFLDEYTLNIKSDHLSQFTADAGIYFNLPVSRQFVIGTKFLVGRNYMHGIDINAEAKGYQRDVDMTYDTDNGRRFLVYEVKGTPADNGKAYSHSWDYLNVNARSSTNFGTGLSFTFAYRPLMAWRIFLDYDFTRKYYDITYSPTDFISKAARTLTFEDRPVRLADYISLNTAMMKKNMSNFVLGGSFCISF